MSEVTIWGDADTTVSAVTTTQPSGGSIGPAPAPPPGPSVPALILVGFNAALIPDNSVLQFIGRDTVNDGGGGSFYYNVASIQPADNIVVFAPINGGRLFRVGWTVLGFNGDINFKWAGVKGDGSNDTAALQLAVNYVLSPACPGTLYGPFGTYAITSVNIYPHLAKSFVFRGDGQYNTKLVKFDASTTPLLNISGSAGGGAGIGVTSKCEFRSFGISGIPSADGMYVDTLAHFSMTSVLIQNCNVGLRSLGSLIFACRSCNLISNLIGFLATTSPVNLGYSNLISLDDCVLQSNSQYAAYLGKGQNVVFRSCDIESNAATTGKVIYVANTWSNETTLSSFGLYDVWFEANTGDPLFSDCHDTFITIKKVTMYGAGLGFLTIAGASNIVDIEDVSGTEGLNFSAASGYLHTKNCLLPTMIVATPNWHHENTLTSAGAIVDATSRHFVGTTTDLGSGAIQQTAGSAQATRGFIGSYNLAVGLVNVPLCYNTGGSGAPLLWINGYNPNGGAQIVAGINGATGAILFGADASGTHPVFSSAGGILYMKTTVDSLVINVSALR